MTPLKMQTLLTLAVMRKVLINGDDQSHDDDDKSHDDDDKSYDGDDDDEVLAGRCYNICNRNQRPETSLLCF